MILIINANLHSLHLVLALLTIDREPLLDGKSYLNGKNPLLTYASANFLSVD